MGFELAENALQIDLAPSNAWPDDALHRVLPVFPQSVDKTI